MKIIGADKLEDCFDGSVVFGYRFDEAWERETIMRLKSLGEVDYFPDFPRPFFRLRSKSGLQVKGVEGESTCRVIYSNEGKEVEKQSFEGLFVSG